jgi:cell division protein FtsB
MISFSNKKVSYLAKLSLTILFVYSIGFIIYRTAIYYKIYFEKEKLTVLLQTTKNETNSLKREVVLAKNKIENINKQYIKKEDLEVKVKDIFERMSILDYNLKYIDAKEMCIDRFIIVAQVSSKSEDGWKAAEGILSYIGPIRKSEKNDTIYFVDYVSNPKELTK